MRRGMAISPRDRRLGFWSWALAAFLHDSGRREDALARLIAHFEGKAPQAAATAEVLGQGEPAERLPEYVARAFHTAMQGRPGPVVLALTAAALLSLTFVPAAVAMFVTGRVEEKENRVMRAAGRAYRPLLDWALKARVAVGKAPPKTLLTM